MVKYLNTYPTSKDYSLELLIERLVLEKKWKNNIKAYIHGKIV